MARPKNQAKRRRELVAAAQRAIASRGLGALRIKDVAEEAGVTGPAVSYYYHDLDDLLVDVYRRLIHEQSVKGPAAIAGLQDPWEQLIALLDVDLPSGPDDVDAVLTYQFAGEPRFARTYGAMSSALRATQVGLYRSVIDTGVTTDRFRPRLESQAVARAVVALADSYGLQVVADEPGVTRASALAEVVDAAAVLVGLDSCDVGKDSEGRPTP